MELQRYPHQQPTITAMRAADVSFSHCRNLLKAFVALSIPLLAPKIRRHQLSLADSMGVIK
jgi:hypothetical protein